MGHYRSTQPINSWWRKASQSWWYFHSPISNLCICHQSLNFFFPEIFFSRWFAGWECITFSLAGNLYSAFLWPQNLKWDVAMISWHLTGCQLIIVSYLSCPTSFCSLFYVEDRLFAMHNICKFYQVVLHTFFTKNILVV